MGMSVLPIVNPLLIGPPMIAVAFGASCGYVDTCSINQLLERFDLQWQCHKRLESNLKGTTGHLLTVTLIVYVLWTIIHLFNRQGPARNKSQNVIDSMSPMLSPFTIETSTEVYHYLLKTDGKEEDDILHEGDEFYDTLTLYICATMWHETKNEMAQMIKSIIRLDEEQDRRKNLKAETEGAHFVLESHIFFDDAWEDLPECGRVPNSYFRQLFELLIELTTVDEDAVAAEGERILVTTPYGGRLVMQLPAGTLLFVHLKDKKLMRHKKRWSQVMYMYYLLGHRIMDTHLTIEDRQHRADNTFIMAIDGDSKFEPHSVIRLLNLMRTKADIGCACGRIHPIGNGVMVWYQKFEYAIAHWFQKAAEHVFGCVLCAPGCFSLFRASALMDDNIMHKYTKMATEPRHFVQYDQGEDRWLSTLILKQGYRIEYDAGADAETYAPEGPKDSRSSSTNVVAGPLPVSPTPLTCSLTTREPRRTTTASRSCTSSTRCSSSASLSSVQLSSSPSAFGTDPTWMMVYNTVPVSLFIAACFVFESKWQLLFAKIASVVYAFIMLAVLVATSSQIVLETAFSPTSIFVLAMIGIFFVAALLHPHEFYNIIFGLIFFLMIPSTYVFLSFYALINLNVINWGTREAVAKATGQAKEKKKAEKSSWMTRWEETMGIIGRMFPCCGRSSEKDVLDKLDSKLAKLDELIVKMEKGGVPTAKVTKEDAVLEDNNDNKDKKREALHAQFASARLRLEDLSENKNQWMESEYLENCDRGKLKPSEEHFWDELIEKYLKADFVFVPIRSTPEEQLEHAKGLVHLRNKVAFGLILLNGLLVLAIFLLQKHKDVLSVQWKPYDGFKWTKMNDRTGQYESTDEALQVDPLGMGIIFFLMGILIVQSIGLIIHRVNTMVRGMHEAAQVEEIFVSNRKRKYDYDGIIESVRAMIDTEIYEEEAHGTRGYKRVSPTGETESRVTNVLYKLDRDTSDFEEERNPNRI
ncbi:hypothetical protein L596_000987 [Steinernema carpocapsae]|uniref:chitin synthase n=1 Tax=Steinernema carpocapsae TaxID=34508 RepID=A0A4U8UJZ9_STECR|nr:hypothetical protein L596_000987 [Steinernema carpocapsae]